MEKVDKKQAQRTRFERLRLALRYRLQGMADVNPRYLKVLEAFNLAELAYGEDLRQSGVKSFIHAIEVTMVAITQLRNLAFPVETLCACLLHDVHEDYNVSLKQLKKQFGKRVALAVEYLSKVRNGEKLSNERYFGDMSKLSESGKRALLEVYMIVVSAKGFDRINNQQTMDGVKSSNKILENITETEEWILPLIKVARRRCPKQEALFELLKLILTNQVALLRSRHSIPAAV